MPKPTPDEKRRQGLENLGSHVRALVAGLPPIVTYADEQALGKVIRSALQAAVKAVHPGRQRTKQVQAHLDAAVKAANRQLARVVQRQQAKRDGQG
ncbi:MAG TPA: hypothetical protein VEB59_08815 [Gemmatimonadales bacterium]|nr:hypothetical protein [Gemmatimonadales bacterium]